MIKESAPFSVYCWKTKQSFLVMGSFGKKELSSAQFQFMDAETCMGYLFSWVEFDSHLN